MFEKKIYLTISLNLTYCLNKLQIFRIKGLTFSGAFKMFI